MDINKSTILLTGGTGSFGKAFIAHFLAKKSFKGTIRIFSRDEFKQHKVKQKFQNDPRLRFLIGDVRDASRLRRAMAGTDVVVHAAALKHVPILEYNPFEAVKTNIHGTQNVIENAIDLGVKKAVLISSDKAVSPVNLYGATKLVAEKIFIHANSYVGKNKTILGVVRYGNVVGSRGSVIPLFADQAKNNSLTITDPRMTRFWITLEQGVDLVLTTLDKMHWGEIFVPKIPSVKIVDIAHTIAPKAKIKIVGIRPGEKIHEVLISADEARHTREYREYFVIRPESDQWKAPKSSTGKLLPEGFSYSSDNNKVWLTPKQLANMLRKYTI